MNAGAIRGPDDPGRLDGAPLIRILRERFPGQVAAISSFGAEAAVLLDLVASVDPALPILSVDTGRLFPETVAYRETLRRHFALTDLRVIAPEPAEVLRRDPDDGLWWTDPDACCALRKVHPLAKAIAGFTVLIDGRKRFHGDGRAALSTVERSGVLLKAAPLATWSQERVERSFIERDLPRHPLLPLGYRSIGCRSCTEPVAEGAPLRAGRWSARGKTECGIHTTPWFGT